jgi:hypothetical protein
MVLLQEEVVVDVTDLLEQKHPEKQRGCEYVSLPHTHVTSLILTCRRFVLSFMPFIGEVAESELVR